jgi:hypothetical protein
MLVIRGGDERFAPAWLAAGSGQTSSGRVVGEDARQLRGSPSARWSPFEVAHDRLRLVGEEVVPELRKLGVKTAVA